MSAFGSKADIRKCERIFQTFEFLELPPSILWFRNSPSRKSIAVEWSQDGDQRHNHGGGLMKKVLIATALLFTALPFTFDGVTPTVSKADARIGRPLTPLSVAGVHRRAVRRTFGVGANLGYRGFHPVARAAAVGAATGWGGSWGSPGWAAPGWGVSVAAPGWG